MLNFTPGIECHCSCAKEWDASFSQVSPKSDDNFVWNVTDKQKWIHSFPQDKIKKPTQVQVNRSIKTLGLERQLQYPDIVKSQGMAGKHHTFHFYQNSGGKWGREHTHTHTLYPPSVDYLCTWVLSPGPTSCLGFGGYTDTQVHTWQHTLKSRGAADRRLRFLIQFKTLRITAENKKLHIWDQGTIEKQNNPPTTSTQSNKKK